MAFYETQAIKLIETKVTLKWLSEPGGTLCMWLSFTISEKLVRNGSETVFKLMLNTLHGLDS